MTRCALQLALVFVAGCASTRAPMISGPQDWFESNGIVLLGPVYDGHEISALLLVKGEPPIVVDRRLPEGASVAVRHVESCSGAPIEFDIADTGLAAPATEDLMRIESGFAYGKTLRLLVRGDDGPACIDVTIGIRDFLQSPEGDRAYRLGRFRLARG